MDQNRVENQVDEGTLQIHLTNASTGIPVKGARITISYTGGPQQVLEEVDTDDSGNTEKITLDAPPLEYSMEPGENQPYAEYTIKVQATGYRDITVSAINILPGASCASITTSCVASSPDRILIAETVMSR